VIVLAAAGCGAEAAPGPAGDLLAGDQESPAGADEAMTGDAIAPDEAVRDLVADEREAPAGADEAMAGGTIAPDEAVRDAAQAALVVGPEEEDARGADEALRAFRASAPDGAGDVDLAAAGWREDPHEGISR
jgi:hypothetical protein